MKKLLGSKIIGTAVILTAMGCGALDEAVDYSKEVVSKSAAGYVEIRDISNDSLMDLKEYSIEGYGKIVDGAERNYIVLRNGTEEVILSVRDLSHEAFLKLKDILTPDDGENGESGADGESGESGVNGSDGSKGNAGSNGDQGEAGDEGERGKKGKKGKKGNSGDDGEDCSIDTRNRTYEYHWYGNAYYHDVYLVCASEELKLGRFKDDN